MPRKRLREPRYMAKARKRFNNPRPPSIEELVERNRPAAMAAEAAIRKAAAAYRARRVQGSPAQRKAFRDAAVAMAEAGRVERERIAALYRWPGWPRST